MDESNKFEDMMEQVGEFGRFQKIICFLLVLSTIPNGYFAMLIVFVGRTPSFRCFVPGFDDILWSEDLKSTTASSYMQSSGELRNTSSENETSTSGVVYPFNSTCSTLESIQGSQNATSYSPLDDSQYCPYGIVYDFEEGRSSIVTEWNLVCERAWIMPMISSIYMGGVLVGSVSGGLLADRFGRLRIFLMGTLLMFVFLGLCGISTSPIMFTVFLFMAGAFGFINYVTAFVIGAEIIITKDRVIIGTLTVGGFAGGYMLLPLFAYYIPNWRNLCFVLASLGVVFIPYIWIMVESPRWLISKGKIEDFILLFRKIARTNGIAKEKTELLITEFTESKNTTESALLVNESIVTPQLTLDEDFSQQQYSCLDLVRTSVVRLRTLIMWFTWFVCSVVYYGVGFNTSNMGGDPYINCFVAAAVEIPAYALVIALLKWQGRKPVLIASLLAAGLTCSAVPFLNNIDNGTAIGFAMAGKLAVSAAFSVIFIYCSELYPTLMRSMGVGCASMASRVGGMLAPHLLYLGRDHESLPYLTMGVLSILACICLMVLPETQNTPLPEKISDLTGPNFPCLKKRMPTEKSATTSPC